MVSFLESTVTVDLKYCRVSVVFLISTSAYEDKWPELRLIIIQGQLLQGQISDR